jgi:hypothetical protein
MGLAEKRAVKGFQDTKFADLKKEIDAAAGFATKLDVQWDSLEVPEYAHLFAEAFAKVYFQPLIGSLKLICTDEMGKAALKKALKKIVICNTGKFHNANGFSFENGELKLDHQPHTNIDDVQERTEALTALLEKSL